MYKEEDGKIIITTNREDYELLLLLLESGFYGCGYLDDDMSAKQISGKLERYNESVERLSRALGPLQRQLDLDDWREYQASRAHDANKTAAASEVAP